MARRQHGVPRPIRLIRQPVGTPIERSATAARTEFFQLLESVAADPTRVIFIEHRGMPDRAALVNEQYLEYVRQLEALVGDLMAQRGGDESFRLCGTAELHADVDEAIAAIRASDGPGRRAHRFRDL